MVSCKISLLERRHGKRETRFTSSPLDKKKEIASRTPHLSYLKQSVISFEQSVTNTSECWTVCSDYYDDVLTTLSNMQSGRWEVEINGWDYFWILCSIITFRKHYLWDAVYPAMVRSRKKYCLSLRGFKQNAHRVCPLHHVHGKVSLFA